MASKQIAGIFGTKQPSADIYVARGEAIDLTITIVNSGTSATPHDGTGGWLNVAWRNSRFGTSGSARRIRRRGNALGVYHVAIPKRDAWYFIDSSYVWDAWFSRDDVDTPIVDVGSIVGQAAIGPGDLVDDEADAVSSVVRIYYGAAAAGLTGTSAIESALFDSDVLSTRDFRHPVSPNTSKGYVAHPAAIGLPPWTLDALAIGELPGRAVTLHDANGALAAYTLRETSRLLTASAVPFILELSHA